VWKGPATAQLVLPELTVHGGVGEEIRYLCVLVTCFPSLGIGS